MAPGHDRPRCVYVDFINTGPAVSKTLRTAIARNPSIRKAGDLCIVDLAVSDGEITGAVGYHLGSGAPVVIAAKATVLATGGLTRLYRRNSASANMGGDGYALALRAGATLIDMEFVQFFPIGHLAPRLDRHGSDHVGSVPLQARRPAAQRPQWRNSPRRYGSDEDGKYVLTRDLATYAITQGSRGRPRLAAWRRLSEFEHCSAAALREAFGPVIDRLAANGIDLTKTPVEVAPIAHYHMGGVKADVRMMSDRARPLCRRRSGRRRQRRQPAVRQRHHRSLVFGRRAGRSAAAHAAHRQKLRPQDCRTALDLLAAPVSGRDKPNTAAMIAHLQAIMADGVGPFRTGAKLHRALSGIAALQGELGERPAGSASAFDLQRLDWFDLRNMIAVAQAVTQSALNREESRGAHQREDFPDARSHWQLHQRVDWRDDTVHISHAPAEAMA